MENMNTEELTNKIKEIFMDRTFDSACLYVKGETDWSEQIMNRLKGNYPQHTDYLDNMFNLYVEMVNNNNSFLARADYLLEHKNTIILKFK